MNTHIKIPIWFWVVGLLAITWNALGVMAYLNEAYMSPEQFAKLPIEIQELYSKRPTWVVAAFATAVFAGLLGSFLLILRKTFATHFFVLSFIAVSLQHSYSFFIAKAHTTVTTFNVVMAGVVFAIALALMFFSQSRKKVGWLS